MELVIPYLLIVFGISPDGEAEIVQRQLAISAEQCNEMRAAQAPAWGGQEGREYHLVCLELPGADEFETLFRESQ